MLSSGQFLTFGPATKSGLISIPIVDDDIFEAKSENFFIGLNTTELRGLHLARQTANLTIKDDDSKLSVIHNSMSLSMNILFVWIIMQQTSPLGSTVLPIL